MTLVILAAGMGSRYGGLKQIDPVTPQGEFIIDFSVYDALISGFDKVVFVIKEENLDIFRETIGQRFEDKVKVEYAFQKLTDIPEGFKIPEGREKPWGTGQALLAAKNIVNEPFAVINSDDFYGRSAYKLLADHFVGKESSEREYCMIGYILRNTLTETGTVSRGKCETTADGMLDSITELTKIKTNGADDDLAKRCEEFLLGDKVTVAKKAKPREEAKIVDIRPLIKSVKASFDSGILRIDAVLSAEASSFLNPEYVIKALRAECNILSDPDITKEYYSIMRREAYKADMTPFR